MAKQFSVTGLISVLCFAVVMTACGGTARVEERSREAVIVTRPSCVVVETFNGNIEVVTGADDKVAVEVTRYVGAGQGDALKTIQFSISQDAETVTVRAQWPADAPTNLNLVGTDLKVSIPAGSPVQAVVGNGNITYRGTAGEGDYGFKVGNGDIVYNAALGQGEYDLGVGNGSIELQLPAEAQFNFDGRVGNGRITSEFPLGNTSAEAHVVKGSIGSDPQAIITAVTGNGRIEVKRSN